VSFARPALLLLPRCDSGDLSDPRGAGAVEIRPREQRATDAGKAPRVLLPSESSGLDLRELDPLGRAASTTPTPASRPLPRNRSIPSSASQRSCPASE